MKNNNKVQNNKKTRFFHNLFYNNKYLAVFSFVAAFIVWIIVVMAFSPETTYKIEDVPVVINIENTTAEKLDLQAFTEQEYTVDVTIVGKRYSITQRDLSSDSIVVNANLNYVDSVGTHSLPLIATKSDVNADYEIVSLSTDEIEVFFDAYKEVQVDLKTEQIPEDLIPEGYYTEGSVLSSPNVTVCGAATQINKLDTDNIFAKVSDDIKDNYGPITETKHYTAVIDLVDNYGNKIDYIKLKDNTTVTITVPVMKKAEFATNVEFTNEPDNYLDFIESITITPETINICATADVVASMKNVTVGTIDFSEIKSGKNVFRFKKEDFSTNLTIFDDVDEVVVTVNVFEAFTKKFNVDSSRITISNEPENCKVSIPKSFSSLTGITLYGSQKALNDLAADDIRCVVDMTGYTGKTGRDEVTAKIVVKNQSCWAYGKYSIPIDVVA